MLLTSKGAAGVAGGGFIALTATLSTIGHIPVVGIMLIFGIDKFMSECRALVNFIGNAVATLFVAKWNHELDVVRARAVFAGKDVEPLFDPSEDLRRQPVRPDRSRTRPRQMHERNWPWPVAPADQVAAPTGSTSAVTAHRPYPAARQCPTGTRRKTMRVLIAPDKFKGSLTAAEVADHLAKGLAEAGAHSRTLPLADGGDGSVAAAVAAGFRLSPRSMCTEPPGRAHRSTVAFDADTTIVEVANTCGLHTLPGGAAGPDGGVELRVRRSHPGGTARSARKRIVLALGGSASTDGGIGMLAALGTASWTRQAAVTPDGGQPRPHPLRRPRRQRRDLSGHRDRRRRRRAEPADRT